MTLFVKLCGMRTEADVQAAVDSGADAVGFVLTPSPRQVTLEQAAALRQLVPEGVLAVAVYHDPSPELIERTAEIVSPDLYQAEPGALAGVAADQVLPVVVDGPDLDSAVAAAHSAATSGMVLVDSSARGGTGRAPDWHRVAALVTPAKVILAGGLDLGNIGEAIAKVRPFGVDVSSGIERRPGEKDHALIRDFMAAARGAVARGELTR